MTDTLAQLRAALGDRYAIDREVGTGGMALVFLARDRKHDRPVAIKVLRPELAASVGAERFLREVRITARLTHPHILPLHDSGEAGGLVYYVMPFVEGETLRDRLRRERQLPLDDAVRIAREAAGALAYAHSHGILHRDIKPENILLESGHAVVADFGIARAITAAGGSPLTEPGLTLGTPAYMSPEQTAGEPLDARSDVYSLGCVLYEMLAGEPPYTSPTVQALMTRRLTEPVPRVSIVRDTVPPTLERVIQQALARLPADRFASAAELADALELEEPGADGARSRRLNRAALAAGAIAVAAVAALPLLRRATGPGPGGTAATSGAVASAFTRALTQLTFREELEEWPAWSPDGRELAYLGEIGGARKVFVRTLATGESRQLSFGPGDELHPGWAPDGRRIVFVRSNLLQGKLEPTDVLGWYSEGGDVWTIDVRSGEERLLVADAFSPAYSPDGTRLAFDADRAGPRRIWITDAAGHNPQQITTDSSEAVVHTSPRWSPDGARIAFRRIESTKSDVLVVDVATKATTRITDDDVADLGPAWSPSGRYVYFTSARGGGLNIWRVPVSPAGVPAGPPEQLTTGAGDDVELAVAPDGRRLAFAVAGINSDLWRLPLDPASGRPTGEPEAVVATTRVESRGAWSPDSRTIAFNSDRLGQMNVWLRILHDGTERRLTTGVGGDYQPSWSPDGTVLAFFSARSGNNDIWTVRVADGRIRQLTRDPGTDTNPFFSPDGRHIAFHSDRNGRTEVWIMGADGSGQRQLTSVGAFGHFMRWSADGRFVTFRSGASARPIARVSVETGALEPLPDVASGAHMSFSPDRSRILDVRNHKTLWVHPVDGATPTEVFAFADPGIRIDYPVWSPDGRWVLFDRAVPRGGDIWILEGIE